MYSQCGRLRTSTVRENHTTPETFPTRFLCLLFLWYSPSRALSSRRVTVGFLTIGRPWLLVYLANPAYSKDCLLAALVVRFLFRCSTRKHSVYNLFARPVPRLPVDAIRMISARAPFYGGQRGALRSHKCLSRGRMSRRNRTSAAFWCALWTVLRDFEWFPC